MLLKFELTMPNVGSWNGKWTGEGKRYLKFRDVPKSQITDLLGDKSERNFHHSFGDGWSANVKVSQSNSSDKRLLSRHLGNGFCGYDWMITSILEHGKIEARKTNSQIPNLH